MKTSPARYLFVLKLAVSFGLLIYVLHRVDVPSIMAKLRDADPRWLAAAVAAGPCSVLLSAWRWQKLSLGLIGYGSAVRYTWIGLFFGSILPGLIGGDVAKGVSLAAQDSRTRDSRLPISILMDKVIGFWVLLVAFLAAAAVLAVSRPNLLPGLTQGIWVVAAIAVAVFSCGVALSSPAGLAIAEQAAARIPPGLSRRILDPLVAAVRGYAGHRRRLAEAAGLSAALHSLNIVALWCVLRALAVPASIGFAAVYYPLLSGLLALPVSISGVGVRDVFSSTMFAAFGLGAETGVAFSWLLLGLGIPNIIVGGLLQCWEIASRGSIRARP